MFNRMREAYREQILRAFKQAPWRKQTQSVAVLAVVLFVMVILGGLYLAVASRAGTAGRDLQALELRQDDLIRENDQLRAELAELRSVTRLEERARALGFSPVAPDAVEYVVVKNYPNQVAAVPPAPVQAAHPATLVDWLAETLSTLLSSSGGGG
jgi:cell division protein FtsL